IKNNRRQKLNKMLLAGNISIVLLSAAVSPVWADDNASAASCFFTCMLNNHCNKSL
ncbi:porin family protein, partial [Salmonella enterica]|nr:porin family protein [Salmonella enterica]ECJ2583564.1 porin family protein [Salmonella enterica]ECJ3109815.1 porin family protein [Salmonella enterica]